MIRMPARNWSDNVGKPSDAPKIFTSRANTSANAPPKYPNAYPHAETRFMVSSFAISGRKPL